MSAQDRTEQTRRAILTAACETIAEVGFEKVRMRMVADRAEVSTALLHYHFETREKLFLEALTFSYESAGRAGYDARPPADAPHTWRLARVIDACLPIDDELRRDFLLWQELHLRAARDADSLAVAEDLYGNVTEWVAGVLRDGESAGEFTRCDTGHLADLVIALTDGYGARVLMGSASMTADDARRQIWSVIAPMIGVTAAFPAARHSRRRTAALEGASRTSGKG